MRENGISVKRYNKLKATVDSNFRFYIAANLLNRGLSAPRTSRNWVGDISYVWTREGWLYLEVILELHSRRVIDLAASNRMKRDLAIRPGPEAGGTLRQWRAPSAGCGPVAGVRLRWRSWSGSP